jgi:uncharacterized membrane protein
MNILFFTPFILFGIGFIILGYLFTHSDQKNTFLNILCLALFAIAFILGAIFGVFPGE